MANVNATLKIVIPNYNVVMIPVSGFWSGVGQELFLISAMIRERFVTRKGIACLGAALMIWTPYVVTTGQLFDKWIVVGAVMGALLLFLGFKVGELAISAKGVSMKSEAVADGVPGNAPKESEDGVAESPK